MALLEVAAGLGGGGRGQVIAACGAGKTLLGMQAAVRLCPAGLVVLTCPSLAFAVSSVSESGRAVERDTGEAGRKVGARAL